MFRLIKEVFIALLRFIKSLAIKFMSLNNGPCVTRPLLFDINLVELKYYSVMISLNKVVEFVTLLMNYLQKYVFSVKWKM